MAVMAMWQGKQWEVSPSRVVALQNLTTAFKLKADTNNDEAGKPSANFRKMELQKLTFDTFISDSVGADVQGEIDSWADLVGESGPFVLGGQQFGADKFYLEEVKISGTRIDDMGRIRLAKLTINLVEDAEEEAKGKQKGKSSRLGAPGIAGASTYSELGTTSAAGVGASAADKASMKPEQK
ncbi:MAG: hypothetical protein ACOX8S_11235 [Christensenellales bacterium]|jgi:hypothetical protein